MSNPYDPNNDAGNNPGNPGGQPPPPPYGSYPDQGGGGAYPPSPYGSSSPYGEAPKKTDAVSITGFVLSLTCCLSIVGAILGFIGLGRTKNNQRKGRWAAISASIIGVIGTLVFAGGIVFIVVLAKDAIGIDDAKVGQCMNITTSDDSLLLREKDCTESHDAEIVYVGEKGDIKSLGDSFVPDDINDLSDAGIANAVCTALLSDDDLAAIGDDVDYGIASEDPNSTASNDPFICYVEPSDGKKVSEPYLG